ncbi:MAG: GNAT family N-acetyltransferase [Pseudomonadota bacterium]
MVPPFDIQPVLIGERVMLRPLLASDYDALYAVASDPEIWAMHPFRDRYKKEVFDGFFADAIMSQGAFVVVDKATDQIIGTTRFACYDPVTEEIEIGWTFFATTYWRTGTNREVKALMLRHIFQFVRIVVFQVGALNFRSRTAVERLGGKLVLEHQRHHGGQLHDYTTYHLTREDALSGALASSLVIA